MLRSIIKWTQALATLTLVGCTQAASTNSDATESSDTTPTADTTTAKSDATAVADVDPKTPPKTWLDVHGAGAQRSDPKQGNPASFPEGRGPQGDAIRIYNYVRLVRGESSKANTYPVVDTGQTKCFDNAAEMAPPAAGAAFYGQDCQFVGLQSAYTDNGDGTITDNNTGLMWVKEHGDKLNYAKAAAGAATCAVGGHADWRLPTIKELYSLMRLDGTDVGPEADKTKLVPFIDSAFFTFAYGPGTSETHINDRIIDAQYASSTECVSDRNLMKRAFGLNLADGRIKSYPQETVVLPQENWDMTFFVKYVRGGNGSYGKNAFTDNKDGTIADAATGLVWDKDDSGKGMNWQEALAWVQAKNAANYKGHADWRLPNAKELQSIVDYTRSPSTTNSPALDPLFNTSTVKDEAGDADYPFFWTGTTHEAMDASSAISGGSAVYIAFGKALGYFSIDSLNGDTGGGQGPVPCTTESDCSAANACPPDATMGCGCTAGPSGQACIPKCGVASDCPAGPGVAFKCTGGFCVP